MKKFGQFCPLAQATQLLCERWTLMTAVWTCQKTFKESVRQGAIMVYGDPKLVKKLQDWLQSSALSRLGSLGESPELTWQAG